MTFRPITLRTTDSRLRASPAKRAVRVIQGLQQKLSPLRRKLRDDVEVTAPMRPAPRGPALPNDLSPSQDGVPVASSNGSGAHPKVPTSGDVDAKSSEASEGNLDSKHLDVGHPVSRDVFVSAR